MAKKQAHGFGFNPDESRHHFLVMIPSTKAKDGKVLIYERFEWEEPADEKNKEVEQKIDQRFDRLKVEIASHKWALIAEGLQREFNERLKQKGFKHAGWKIGQTPVHRLFGKEMVLLAWAVEDSDPRVIPDAIKNWLGLKPEERCWLYTMTNASSGDYNTKYGWRKAIRYALTENPVTERYRQGSLFDQYVQDSI